MKRLDRCFNFLLEGMLIRIEFSSSKIIKSSISRESSIFGLSVVNNSFNFLVKKAPMFTWPCTQELPSLMVDTKFLFLFITRLAWKKFEFLSLSASQSSMDFCL